MIGSEWDHELWWTMLCTGIAAAMVSIGTSFLGRKHATWMTERQRFFSHLLSYLLLTASIIAFVIRGLIAPR